MNQEEATNCMIFLDRVSITGHKEAQAMRAVTNALSKIIQEAQELDKATPEENKS